MIRWLAVAGLSALLALGVAGCTSVLELKVGQCFDSPSSGTVSSVQTVDCSQPHVNEVFAVLLYPGDKDAAFPGNQAVTDRASADCPPPFQAYVGKPYDQSEFEIVFLTPTAETWKTGDRAIVCTLTTASEAKISGSMKGSNR